MYSTSSACPVGQCGVDLAEALEQAAEAPAQVVLTRVVRSVSDPEADDRRPDELRDLDALETVVDGLSAHGRVRVAQAAEPVDVVLEQVRVDCADTDALALGELPELVPIIHSIPRDVDRDARAGPGESVDERRVGDALVDGARGARPWEDVEASARVAIAPRRRLDLEPAELGKRRLDVGGALAKELERPLVHGHAGSLTEQRGCCSARSLSFGGVS